MNNPPARRHISVKECASYLSMTEGTIYTLLYQRKIPGARIGRSWRINLRALDAQLAEQLKKQ